MNHIDVSNGSLSELLVKQYRKIYQSGKKSAMSKDAEHNLTNGIDTVQLSASGRRLAESYAGGDAGSGADDYAATLAARRAALSADETEDEVLDLAADEDDGE